MDGAKYLNGTTSQAVVTGNGKIYGIIVNSNTSGTFKLWDNTAGSGTVICNTYTVGSGSSVVKFPQPIEFYTGLYITVGGTLDYTLVYRTSN